MVSFVPAGQVTLTSVPTVVSVVFNMTNTWGRQEIAAEEGTRHITGSLYIVCGGSVVVTTTGFESECPGSTPGEGGSLLLCYLG